MVYIAQSINDFPISELKCREELHSAELDFNYCLVSDISS